MQKRLYAFGQYMDKNSLGKSEVCNGSVSLHPLSVALVQPLVFSSEATHPNAGEWRIRYRFERCGESIIYNALFRANAQGIPTIVPMPPGTSKASTRLMQDLNPGLFIAASAKNGDNKDCKLVAVTNTSVTTESHTVKTDSETLEGVWEESWTVRTCSGTFSMDFCFVPDKKGGGTTWLPEKCEPTKIATARSMSAISGHK